MVNEQEHRQESATNSSFVDSVNETGTSVDFTTKHATAP